MPVQSRRTFTWRRETRSSLKMMSCRLVAADDVLVRVGDLDALALARPVHDAEVGLRAAG